MDKSVTVGDRVKLWVGDGRSGCCHSSAEAGCRMEERSGAEIASIQCLLDVAGAEA